MLFRPSFVPKRAPFGPTREFAHSDDAITPLPSDEFRAAPEVNSEEDLKAWMRGHASTAQQHTAQEVRAWARLPSYAGYKSSRADDETEAWDRREDARAGLLYAYSQTSWQAQPRGPRRNSAIEGEGKPNRVQDSI